jgi:hypothetical protein
MGLIFAAKFCSFCSQCSEIKERIFAINNVAEQIETYVSYWMEKFYNEDINEKEFNNKMSMAIELEKTCLNCDGKEAKIFNIFNEGEKLIKNFIKEEDFREKNISLKKKMKKLKIQIEGNVYRSKLFKGPKKQKQKK